MHLGMRLERKENRFNDIYRSWEWNTSTTETNVLNQLLFIIISQIYSNIICLPYFTWIAHHESTSCHAGHVLDQELKDHQNIVKLINIFYKPNKCLECKVK